MDFRSLYEETTCKSLLVIESRVVVELEPVECGRYTIKNHGEFSKQEYARYSNFLQIFVYLMLS